MANEEQLAILKQGVDVWNKWREDNPNVVIDFRKANLYKADLTGATLNRANLREAQLIQADLSRAWLDEANLREANLYEAKLNRADLRGAYLREANLRGADLSQAKLNGADFIGADLLGSIFLKARVGKTIFGDLDLRQSTGLEDVVHNSPSTIGADTISLSKGKIPEAFLKGCGLSDWEIETAKLYDPDLSNEEINNIQYRMYDLRATQALQISPLFISYDHDDSIFVDRLEHDLNKKGVRFWRDVHDMKSGRMEKQIDRAIRHNPTVLLILSENSIKSDWVEHEVRTARELEKELGHDTLCPVALDESWKDSPWPKRVMEQVMEYNILDFSEWEDDVKFEGMFRRLIDGLELFYKG